MKNFILTATIALIATTTIADDLAPYGKIAVGWAHLPHNKLTVNDRVGSDILKSKGEGTFFTGALGMGSRIKDNLRADLELYLDDGIKGQKQYKNSVLNFKTKTIAGFANVYFDHITKSKFMPFVMAGIGYAHNKTSIYSCTKRYTGTSNGMAYQFGSGIGYAINKEITAELGYRFVNKGVKTKMLNSGEAAHIKGHRSNGRIHGVFAGVRMSF
jgi:opacity protein-like surface antigen